MSNIYNQGYNQGYQHGYGKFRLPKKRSGCKMGTTKDGRKWISGWNVSRRRGFISMIGGEYKGTRKHKSGTGREFENWRIKIEYRDTGNTQWVGGLYYLDNKKLIIPELGMVANPNAPQGGYFGTYKRNS